MNINQIETQIFKLKKELKELYYLKEIIEKEDCVTTKYPIRVESCKSVNFCATRRQVKVILNEKIKKMNNNIIALINKKEKLLIKNKQKENKQYVKINL